MRFYYLHVCHVIHAEADEIDVPLKEYFTTLQT